MTLRKWLLDLFYPPKCVFCGSILPDGGDGICASCAGKLPYTSSGGERHGDFFSVCLSPLYYEAGVRDSILRYKFRGLSSYAGVYGRLISDCLLERGDLQFDLVTWAPLSRRRLKKRGYDQAMLLALEVADRLSLPCRPLLEKHRHVPAQSGMGTEEKRRANISGAYRPLPGGGVQGLRILLIDDVCTTGSTLSECARVLLMAGAGDVACACLARKRGAS